MIPPRRIALSGGGMKGIAHVGALEALEERGLLRCVKEYVGTSSGALIAFCLVIGYSLKELRTLCTLFDFTKMQNLEPEVLLQFPEQFGLDDGENLDRLLNVLLRAKGFPPNLKFADLSGSQPALRVFAVDINVCEHKEFSAAATPRVELRQAVRASMSIPLFFTPVKDPDTGNSLVDGGLIAHFPFHHLSHSERLETIGIAFSSVHKISDTIPLNIGLFVLQLYFSVYHHQNVRLLNEWGNRIIIIPCGQFPSIYFDAEVEHKKALLQSGRDGVEEFFSRKAAPPSHRRKSLP